MLLRGVVHDILYEEDVPMAAVIYVQAGSSGNKVLISHTVPIHRVEPL